MQGRTRQLEKTVVWIVRVLAEVDELLVLAERRLMLVMIEAPWLHVRVV